MNCGIRNLVGLVLMCALMGCGGGGGSQGTGSVPSLSPVSILLSEMDLTLPEVNHFTFIAIVTGTDNKAVTWAIREGSSGGSITTSGIYTAPRTTGVFHVIATSQADPTRQATATVSVVELHLSVVPSNDVLGPLGVRDFNALVDVVNVSTAIGWGVQEGAPGGTIKASGQYTAPSSLGLFHVIASSTQDPSKSATASVTVVPSGFRPTSDMSDGREAHTATLLPSGKVLVAGGDPCLFDFYYQDCPVRSADIYDAGSGKFTATGNMSVPRVFHTATLLSNGKVLVAGGHDSSAELYDPSSVKFAATGSMSVSRDSHTATLLPNGKVLIAGGQNVSGSLATAELYDPGSGTFTATGSLATARRSHTATLLANGEVLITGGLNSTDELSTAELYDPASGTFKATNIMTAKRAFHAATLLTSGNVLITGGYADRASLSSTEVYDVAAGSFTVTRPMMKERDSHVALLLPNGNVLVTGGSTDYTAELYSPGSGTFTQTGSMRVGRYLPAAVSLQDGRVLVSGGSETSTAEVFK